MDKLTLILTTVICTIVVSIFTSIFSIKSGVDIGRIQVASGEVNCHLTEKPDKTTEWECR